MSRTPRAYLKDRTGEVVEARLVAEMTVEAVAQANASWRSLVEAHRTRLIAQEIPRAEWPQHHHWDWANKAERYGGLLSYRFVGIEHAGTVQGMMMVNLDAKRCRVLEQQGKPQVYVEYLAAAPWNSPLFVAEPLFTGVGTMLMFAAVQASFEQGYRGRIGLHSLPQAETLYHRCGMTSLGVDADYYDLCYFEMTTKQAELFLRSRRSPMNREVSQEWFERRVRTEEGLDISAGLPIPDSAPAAADQPQPGAAPSSPVEPLSQRKPKVLQGS